jgi:hypothetical protein
LALDPGWKDSDPGSGITFRIRNTGIVFRFRLYLKERELATNITSICLHSDFLLATTLDHRFDQKDMVP